MGRTPSAYYYEVTRKNPGPLRPSSIKAITYTVMRRLKRAGEPRIIDEVLAHKDFKTRQEDPEGQVKWYLWDFSQRGLVKRLPSRRYHSPRCDGGGIREGSREASREP